MKIYKIYKDSCISVKTGNYRPAFEEIKETKKIIRKQNNIYINLKKIVKRYWFSHTKWYN